MTTSKTALWKPNESILIPVNAPAAEVAEYAKQQLSDREVKSIVNAYKQGDFEMMSTFVWAKAMASLRKQLSSLGMEFIGEMLGRVDIDENSSIEEAVTEYQLIQLAEDLGMIGSTEAMRLRHSLETITHFIKRDLKAGEDEQMLSSEAEICLRACVQSILAYPKISVALKFAEFRKNLEGKVFSQTDREIKMLIESPYLFQRTTLSVLLALAKSAGGAQLDNALANLNTILPMLWERLRKPEKWQTGQTYAETYAAGRFNAAAGVKKALMRVQGFDFVPETLRSSVFSKAAGKVLEVHDAYDNFHNEQVPMDNLAQLGSSIPLPAFPVCMSATMSIRLGNKYGYTWAAQSSVTQVLDGLSKDRWEYYLNECLPSDRRILEKLLESKPLKRWTDVISAYKLDQIDIKQPKVAKLLKNPSKIASVVYDILTDLGYSVAH